MGITNVTIHNEIDLNFNYNLSFGAPKSSKELISIMNKLLESMPKDIQETYYDKWISFGRFMNISDGSLKVIIFSILGAVLLILLVGVWNYNLRRLVKIRTKSLETLTKELENRVADRTKHLENANEKIIEMEKIDALSRISIGLSHEINTPLGNSLILASYIEEKLVNEKDNLDPVLYKEFITIQSKITDNLNRINTLIENLKSVTNYHYSQSYKQFSLGIEIESIIQIFKMDDQLRLLSYRLKLDNSIQVYGTKSSFLYLLSEICSNAFEHGYNKEAGVIDIILYKDGPRIVLEIKDYGSGISNEALPMIFEPFYTTKRMEQHVGFGLYGVYNLVMGILHGEVSVSSVMSEGTNIKISFDSSKELN